MRLELSRWCRIAATALTLALVCVATAHAQYFGRNKVQYRTFDFQILKTEHFDIYYYPEEAEAATTVSRLAERWYARLTRFFGHQLRGRQPVILYAVPAHFQQTNAVEGLLGEGTGGVTEGLRRRIVLPVAGSLADTDHVLGHELVHAYQYDMTGQDPRDPATSAPGIVDFPLWFVEGMAEYVSLGPVDAQTAMWLRDAALREKLPKIKDLDDPKYFPYRWGHAFWAYIGAKYGDRMVASLVRSAANPRNDLNGLARQLGTDPDTLTAEWHQAIRDLTQAVVSKESSSLESELKPLISQKTGSGRYNVGPQISPDGKKIAFFSERDLFAFDLYIADAESGRILRKLSQSASDSHFESLQFLYSAGAWSPDGQTFCITATREGKPELVLMDPSSGRIRKEIKLSGLDDALNPSFSPDGHRMVLSGNQGGALDLYLVDLATAKLDRLTHDWFADLEPEFTPDSASIVFVTERFTTDPVSLTPGALRLARLDLATRTVTSMPAFLRGKHLSPHVSPDGRTVTFIGEPDGISNLYRMPIEGGPIVQITAVPTGVAGITTSSPALSMSSSTGRLVFSVYQDDGETIFSLDEKNMVHLVPPVPSIDGAVLAGRTGPNGDVERFLADYSHGLPQVSSPAPSQEYKQNLMLEALGQPTASASISSYGFRATGSFGASFSDMLGDRLFFVSGQIGGSLADLGGQLAYINRRHRWNWGIGLNAIPDAWEYGVVQRDPDTGAVQVQDVIRRQTTHGVTLLAARPFNSTTRLEFGGDLRRVTISDETQTLRIAQGEEVSRDRTRTTIAGPFNLAEGTVALVHDTSFFGATSPIYGERYRIAYGKSAGSIAYSSIVADWRRYFMPKKPVTLGVRVLHYGRYGPDSSNANLLPAYLGYPEFVRGYGVGSFSTAECQIAATPQCAIFKNLLGTRMAVANFEARAPLVGLFKGDLRYGRVPVDVGAFFDAGITWGSLSQPIPVGGSHDMVRSAGGLARVNAFGWFIIEVSAARAFDRADRNWQWQVGFRQGF